jgi:hypothetical protein
VVKLEEGAEMAVLLLHHSWSRNIAITMQRDIRESGKVGRVSFSSYGYPSLCSTRYVTLISCIIVTLSCVSALHEMLAPNAVIKVAPCPQRRDTSRFMPVPFLAMYHPMHRSNAPVPCSNSNAPIQCVNDAPIQCKPS